MAVYGYHRTSTKEQHLDRGITAIKEFCEKNGLELEGLKDYDPNADEDDHHGEAEDEE